MSGILGKIGTAIALPYFVLTVFLVRTISYALMPTVPTPKPADITDFDAPTAEEGRPIPVIFGTIKVTGPNVLWYGGLYNEAIRKSSGKK